MSSNDAIAARDLERAEGAMRRRIQGEGVRFLGIRQAVGWYYEARERAQGARGWSPRMEASSGGALVHVQVDGGRASDPHEHLAAVSTLGRALRDLAEDYPQPAHFLMLSVRDGFPVRKIADRVKLSCSTVSAQIGKAESYLRGRLRGSGMLV